MTQSISWSTASRSPDETASRVRSHRSSTCLTIPSSRPRLAAKSLALPRYSPWMSRALASLPLASRTLRGRFGGCAVSRMGEPPPAPPGHVVADLADRPDWVLQAEVAEDNAGLDH